MISFINVINLIIYAFCSSFFAACLDSSLTLALSSLALLSSTSILRCQNFLAIYIAQARMKADKRVPRRSQQPDTTGAPASEGEQAPASEGEQVDRIPEEEREREYVR